MHVVGTQVSARIMMTPPLWGIEYVKQTTATRQNKPPQQRLRGQRGERLGAAEGGGGCWGTKVHTATISASHLLEPDHRAQLI